MQKLALVPSGSTLLRLLCRFDLIYLCCRDLSGYRGRGGGGGTWGSQRTLEEVGWRSRAYHPGPLVGLHKCCV